jgi:SAM-dependent methyltransferase
VSGFHPLRLIRKTLARSSSGLRQPDSTDLKAVNVAFVAAIKTQMPHDEAMESAIGGGFEQFGPIELSLLRHYGLPVDGHLVDVGCGSGRLTKPLAAWLTGTYLGVDLVPDLIAHARKIAARDDWRFEVIDHIGIPEVDGRADMVCFFSVLTHLLHEQSYWYLEEARRVLKPGGTVVFSFLEFREPAHLQIFRDTVTNTKRRHLQPLNTFIERGAIEVWAQELGMDVVDIRDGGDAVVAEGALGQSICVLRKPV